MIVVRLEAIGRDYETTEQDSGRVVVDGVAEGWEVVGVMVMDGETEGEGDAIQKGN